MPTLVACLWRRVEAIQLGRVPTHFGPATRLRRPESQWNQGALATSQVEMCPRTANSGQKPEPEGRAVVVELDEMWHFLKKSRTNSGCGRLGIVLRGGSSTGNWAVVTPPPSNECWNA